MIWSWEFVIYKGSVHVLRSNTSVHQLSRGPAWSNHRFYESWISINGTDDRDIVFIYCGEYTGWL